MDGTNFVPLKTASGVAVGETIVSNSTYIVNSNGLYASGVIRFSYTKGNASAGGILLGLSYGN